MTRREVPYRSPAGKAPPIGRPDPDDGGLDAAAFAARDRKKAALEAQAAKYRAETATRQVRFRAGLSLFLGLVAAALAAPAVMSHGLHSRSLSRMVLVAPTLVFYAAWTYYAGTGGADSLDAAPRWVKVGGAVSAVLGLLLGFAILFWH